MRKYSSFEEIDKDLEILRLQTEIDMEEIKLSIDETKSKISPVSLAGSAFGSVVKHALLFKAVSKIFAAKR